MYSLHIHSTQVQIIGEGIVGTELINIVEPEPIEQLTEDLREFFAEKQLELVEVQLTGDNHWKPKH